MADNSQQSIHFHKLKVSIIGLGLIGGSLARVLTERLGVTDITVVNRSRESIQQAVLDGNALRGFTELNEYVYKSDLIFICTPVKRALEYLDALSGKVNPDCIITDVGSTKGEIIRYVNQMPHPPCFIGGHPMAGTEKAGYGASFAHLFENAFYVLSASITATPQAMEQMITIVKGIGAIPVVIDAEEHDKSTACISHVPHIIASALVNLVNDLDSREGQMQMLAAGGFKDITRIASSSPEMWENIILSNKTRISEILDYYIHILQQFKLDMAGDLSEKIYGFFDTAKNYRDSLPASKRGLINPLPEVIVDVVDKPGIIGEIATLLGKNQVNIKNINVSNSRELEQGCLKITLQDADSMNTAYALLNEYGYKVYQ